jgi:hypothetical protein
VTDVLALALLARTIVVVLKPMLLVTGVVLGWEVLLDAAVAVFAGILGTLWS